MASYGALSNMKGCAYPTEPSVSYHLCAHVSILFQMVARHGVCASMAEVGISIIYISPPLNGRAQFLDITFGKREVPELNKPAWDKNRSFTGMLFR